MGITISGSSGLFYRPAVPAVVQIKPTWGGSWQTAPELELQSATVCSAGHGLDSASVSRRFGALKQPWESAATQKRPANLAHYWLRVMLAGDAGWQQAWVGRIRDEAREVYGAGTGQQTWQCYGPIQLLDRIPVSASYWQGDADAKRLGWVPGMNRGGARGAVYGNRAATKMDAQREGSQAYVFGGKEAWSRYDLLEYLVEWFANEDDDGPRWRITGQTEPLKTMRDALELPSKASLNELIRLLIPTQYGMDWTVDATDDGFALRVFSLSARSWSWGGVTVPANQMPVRIQTGRSLDNLTTRLVGSGVHQYRRVRVLGQRIVVCCTLWGPSWSETQPHAGSLVAGWSTTEETDYRQAGGKEDPDEIDKYRDQSKFLLLWSRFTAPADWDLHDGQAAPQLDTEGQLAAGQVADYQQAAKETLDWLPLWEGFDYSTDPATDNTGGADADLLKPMLFVSMNPEQEKHKLAEALGLSLSVASNDWGIYCPCNPRHRAAWRTMQPADPVGGDDQPAEWDWRWYAATIAFLSDQRLCLEYEDPQSLAGDTLEIEVDGAEAWYLAPNTLVGLDAEGNFVNSGLSGRMIRNDRDKLGLVMVGAIARYLQPRARAEIVAKRMLPWGGLIGGLLDHVDDGTGLQALRCPITQITWQAKDQTTTVLAGHAQ